MIKSTKTIAHAHGGTTNVNSTSASSVPVNSANLNDLRQTTTANLGGKSRTDDLMRFSVAMPESLLMDFDQLVARRGLAKNRSEVIRDLVREALIESRSTMPGVTVMGTLTIVYDHHSSDLQNKLHQIQHDCFDNIVSMMHVHVDSHTCLEVIVLRGESDLVQTIANMILGTKGVKNGKLVLAATEG